MKLIHLLALILLASLLPTGCSLFKTTPATPPPAMIPMRFDYTPPTEGVTKSNEIKFALINPRFVPSFTYPTLDPYRTFVKNMGADFVEMLSARGYPYAGPYQSIDEMVYSDKKSTDLILETEVDLQFSGDGLSPKYSENTDYVTHQTTYSYYLDGVVTLSGKLNLTCSEPFTHTKVWVKSIPIEPTTFAWKSYNKYTNKNIPVTDPTIWNALVENMESISQKSLKTAWNHLDPEELKVKKNEAAEIKKNSGFIKN
jgi:hypothetical protein